ncbi:glycosyltransferase family 4 protein [Roseobacter weihaiensis]|uniref:glycosyltransferase family 4 protein n=1 Tax=Roseobacter weihaiensis TaxID=2763262 RepID=UPI001D0A192D|nr:glycosyltransferase family 1 protein [Roseobacter sp. H9]
MRPAAFAIPGDIATLTGGYIYERHLLGGLRALGHPVQHLQLADSFPDPTPAEMADAVAQLKALDPTCPMIVDGLVFGAIDPTGLAETAAPVIAMIHHPLALETGLDQDRARHLFDTEKANLRHAAHVLVPSAHTRAVLIERYGADPERITIVPPGVAPATGPPIALSPPLILSVGILHPRKGHDTLLAALAQLPGRDWQAVIVGKEHAPGERARLTALRDAHGLSSQVRLAGRVPRAELDVLYRSAYLFALATRYEGYGMVFDEALVHGLPIVSCDVGAVPMTVPKAARRLVAEGDAMALSEAIASLLLDAKLRNGLSDAAARAGAQRPGWEATAAQASMVLERL